MTTGEFTEHLRQSQDNILRSPFRCPEDNCAQFGFTDRTIVLRFILRYVIGSSYDVITFVVRWSYDICYDKS